MPSPRQVLIDARTFGSRQKGDPVETAPALVQPMLARPVTKSGQASMRRESPTGTAQEKWYAGLDLRTANALRGSGHCQSRDDVFRLVIADGLQEVPGLGHCGTAKVRAWLGLGPMGTRCEPRWGNSTAAATRFLERRGYLVIARIASVTVD